MLHRPDQTALPRLYCFSWMWGEEGVKALQVSRLKKWLGRQLTPLMVLVKPFLRSPLQEFVS